MKSNERLLPHNSISRDYFLLFLIIEHVFLILTQKLVKLSEDKITMAILSITSSLDDEEDENKSYSINYSPDQR